MPIKVSEEQKEAMWNRAVEVGMSRRKFIALLSAGSAAAVMASCAPQVILQTPPPPNIAPGTPPTPAPPATRLVDQPTPLQFFNSIGAANYETRFELMANRMYQTPNSFFFLRSHTSTPVIDASTWKLSVEGDGVSNPFSFSYDDLLRMPATTVTRYIECAGNGRSFYSSLLNNPAQGGQWHFGAFGIADWTGVKLSYLLNKAGIKSNAVDVMPAGLDQTQVRRPMPVSKAMMDDTIVAYMMNGDVLPLDHGFPARLITPGWVGVSNIKWVGKITVSTTPQTSDWNTILYVLIGPDYPANPPALGPALNNQVMKSALCLPWPATLPSGQQKVFGYAWSPNGKISKVDVSLDGGTTFQKATLVGSNIEKAGTRWEFTFNAKTGNMTLTPRAVDDKGNVQYPVSQQKWNQQGYIFGAMVPHPVTVT